MGNLKKPLKYIFLNALSILFYAYITWVHRMNKNSLIAVK